MRKSMMVILAGGLLASAAISASPSQDTPDQIICAISHSCGEDAPDPSKRLQAGKEAGFELVVPPSSARSTARPAPHPVMTAGSGMRPKRTALGSSMHRPKPGLVDSDNSVRMNLPFELGSSELTPDAKSQADAFVIALNSDKLAGMRFAIEGHTDAIGGRDLNLELSQKRAQAVVDYLVQKGVVASRLQAKGYGFDKPLPGTSAYSPANRRVALVKLS